jgi:hypothetical protein
VGQTRQELTSATPHYLALLRTIEKKTSSSGKSADADHPAKLVAELETTAFGCMWLRGQWEELLEQAGHLWQSPDRLKSISLLGRQPADAATDRTIAEIFVASDALHHSGTSAFADLFSDIDETQLKKFLKRVKARWPDLFDIDNKEKGRAYLSGLAEANIERLNAFIGEFEQKSGETARRTVERLTRDNSPEGHRMRNYVDKSRDALDRRMAKYDKYKEKEKMKDQDERNPRRIMDEVRIAIGRTSGIERGAEETSVRASGGLGDQHQTSPGRRMWLDSSAKGGGMPEEVDLSWAYELATHSVDVSDAEGLAESCDNTPLGEVDALAARLEPRPPRIGSDYSRPVEVGHAGRSGGEANEMTEPAGKGQDFTNKPKLDDLADSTQPLVPVDVETNLEIEPGLDNVAGNVTDVDGIGEPENGELKAGLSRTGPLAVEPEDKHQRTLEASEVVQAEAQSSEVQTRCQVSETQTPKLEIRKRRSATTSSTLASAVPASKVQNRKLERKRQRLERERTERKAIERKVEQALIKGDVTSASKLIEEVLWPAPKAGRQVRGSHSRSP